MTWKVWSGSAGAKKTDSPATRRDRAGTYDT
jgi:hypothetical protein